MPSEKLQAASLICAVGQRNETKRKSQKEKKSVLICFLKDENYRYLTSMNRLLESIYKIIFPIQTLTTDESEMRNYG